MKTSISNDILLLYAISGTVFLILALYNILLYFFVRKDLYYKYSSFVFAISLHILMPVAQHFFGKSPIVLSIITASASGATFAWFASSYLQITIEHAKGLFFLYRGIIVILAITGILELLNSVTLDNEIIRNTYAFLAAFGTLSSVIITIIAGVQLFRTSLMARVFTYTFLPAIVASVLYTVAWISKSFDPTVDVGWVPFAFVGLMVLQIMLFSIVIGYSLREYQKDQFRQQKDLNKLLADEVEKQTIHLQKANQLINEKNQELQEVNAVKNKIFSVVTHDLRGSFSNIFGLVNVLKSAKGLEGEYKEALKYLTSTMESTNELISRILHWSTAQMEGIKPSIKQVDVSQIVNEIIEFHQIAIQKKGLKIEVKLEEKLSAKADKDMLHSAARNLLSNAIKFSYPEKKIVLKGYSDKKYMYLEIVDRGIGMEPEWFDNLISRKEIVSQPGTSGEKGNGFGLLITRDFLNLNKGELLCKSSPGKGTSFIIKLPAN